MAVDFRSLVRPIKLIILTASQPLIILVICPTKAIHATVNYRMQYNISEYVLDVVSRQCYNAPMIKLK